MALALTDLLTQRTETQLEQQLLLSLQGAGFPITDWESGGVERTLVEMETDALYDLVASGIPTMVGGGFVGYATGDWLTFLAAQLYDLERSPATFTQQIETLYSEAGTGVVTLSAGELSFQAASGLVYYGPTATADDPGPTWVIPDGGELTITIQSQHPNDSAAGLNYIDPPGTITTMQTQIAGISCDNVAPDFSPVGQTGTGTGSVTPSRTTIGITPTPHAFDVVIVASGDLGVATFKYRYDGGAFSAELTTAATYDLPGLTTITFADGAGSPSFFEGDVYNFATPGSPTTFQGTDEEDDGSLRGRCRARWPSLSEIPTEDKYATWAKRASSEVVRARVTQDPTVPGQVNLVLAGQAGPVSPAVVNTVAAYIIAREGIGDLSTVASAVALPIVPAGTVYAPASKIAAIKVAAQLLWQTAVGGSDIGGEVLLSTLIQILKDTGCSDVLITSLTLNGVNGNVDLVGTQVATITTTLANALTWIAVKG